MKPTNNLWLVRGGINCRSSAGPTCSRRLTMNTRSFVLILSLLTLLAGCGGVATQPRPSDYYTSLPEPEETDSVSLFASDTAILSDQDINRILAHRYTPQPQNRIAIIAAGQPYWRGWSDELARTGTEVQSELVTKLRSSPLVYDAAYLPSLLVPKKKTVGYYREAAARYQADLLLIYRASSLTYENDRFFSPDKSKSYCNVEAILLDTRTGIVPFAVTTSQDFLTEKTVDDINFGETMRRAELQALRKALSEVADEALKFLSQAQ